MDIGEALARARQERLRLTLEHASVRGRRLAELAEEWARDGRDPRAVATLRLASARAGFDGDARVARGIVVADVRRLDDLHLARLVGAVVAVGTPAVLVGAAVDPGYERLGIGCAEGEWGHVAEADDVVIVEAGECGTTVLLLPHGDVDAAVAAMAAEPVGRVLAPAEQAQDLAFALQRRIGGTGEDDADPDERARRLDAAIAQGAVPLGDPRSHGRLVVVCPDPLTELLAHPVGRSVVPVGAYGDAEQAVALTQRWRPQAVWLFGTHADHTRRVARALDAAVVQVNPAGTDDAAALLALGDRIARERRIVWRD